MFESIKGFWRLAPYLLTGFDSFEWDESRLLLVQGFFCDVYLGICFDVIRSDRKDNLTDTK